MVFYHSHRAASSTELSRGTAGGPVFRFPAVDSRDQLPRAVPSLEMLSCQVPLDAKD